MNIKLNIKEREKEMSNTREHLITEKEAWMMIGREFEKHAVLGLESRYTDGGICHAIQVMEWDNYITQLQADRMDRALYGVFGSLEPKAKLTPGRMYWFSLDRKHSYNRATICRVMGSTAGNGMSIQEAWEYLALQFLHVGVYGEERGERGERGEGSLTFPRLETPRLETHEKVLSHYTSVSGICHGIFALEEDNHITLRQQCRMLDSLHEAYPNKSHVIEKLLRLLKLHLNDTRALKRWTVCTRMARDSFYALNP